MRRFIFLFFFLILSGLSKAQVLPTNENDNFLVQVPEIFPRNNWEMIGKPNSDATWLANGIQIQTMVWNEKNDTGAIKCQFAYKIFPGTSPNTMRFRSLDTNIAMHLKGSFKREFTCTIGGVPRTVLVDISKIEEPDVAVTGCTLSNGVVVPVAIVTGLYPFNGFGKMVVTAFLYNAPGATLTEPNLFSLCHIAAPLGPFQHWEDIASNNSNSFFPTNATENSTRIKRNSRTCLKPEIDCNRDGSFTIGWIESEQITFPAGGGLNGATPYTYGNVYSVQGSTRQIPFRNFLNNSATLLGAEWPFFQISSSLGNKRENPFLSSANHKIVEDIIAGPEISGNLLSTYGYGSNSISDSAFQQSRWLLPSYQNLDVALGDTLAGRQPIRSYAYFTEWPISPSQKSYDLTLMQVEGTAFNFPNYHNLSTQAALNNVYATLKSNGSISLSSGAVKQFRIDQVAASGIRFFPGNWRGKQVRIASTGRMDSAGSGMGWSSRMPKGSDVTLVLSAASDTAFSLPNGSQQSKIMAFMVRNGVLLTQGTSLSGRVADLTINPGISHFIAINAQVCHGRWGTATYQEEFVIAFEMGERSGRCPDRNIVARIFNSNGSPGSSYYACMHQHTRGNHFSPSVNARGSIYFNRATSSYAFDQYPRGTVFSFRTKVMGQRQINQNGFSGWRNRDGLERTMTTRRIGDIIILKNQW